MHMKNMHKNALNSDKADVVKECMESSYINDIQAYQRLLSYNFVIKIH